MLHLALFFLSVSALTCKNYIGSVDLTDETCPDPQDQCIKVSWADSRMGHCARGHDCAYWKSHFGTLKGDLRDWKCSLCDTDGCNPHTSTTPSPNSGNRPATSKAVHTLSSFGCSQVIFTNDCPLEKLTNYSYDSLGECGDEYQKTCVFEIKNTDGEKFSSPMTISADKTDGCGEGVFTLFTKECGKCTAYTNLMGAVSHEVLSGPTCEDRDSDGFINDFINKLKDGDMLYIGIVAAAIVIPLICCLICCCCCTAQPRNVSYAFKSAV